MIRMKKNQGFLLAALFFVVTAMSSCEIIGDIFQAGMWAMLIIIILVVALIYWIIRKIKR